MINPVVQPQNKSTILCSLFSFFIQFFTSPSLPLSLVHRFVKLHLQFPFVVLSLQSCAGRFYANLIHFPPLPDSMYLPTALLSIIVLAGGTLAQYGSGAGSGGYGTGSSDTGTGESMASGGSSSMPTSAPSPLAASPASAGAATPSGHVKVHVVKVSNKKGSLTFEPKNLQVAAGHMVQFQFYPKVSRSRSGCCLQKGPSWLTAIPAQSHSVVQSTFDQPCQPIQNNMPSASGFFSGFMPVKAGAEMKPSYTIMVNDTKPIWYYCSQGDHCQKGMVGVINPYADPTLPL